MQRQTAKCQADGKRPVLLHEVFQNSGDSLCNVQIAVEPSGPSQVRGPVVFGAMETQMKAWPLLPRASQV